MPEYFVHEMPPKQGFFASLEYFVHEILPKYGCFAAPERMGRVDVWAQKKGKLDISHRYNRIPLLPSGPGGILQELVVYDLPGHKGRKIFIIPKLYLETAE